MTGVRSEGRRRTRRGEETRQRILEACIECLQELGYAGTSVEAVMAKSGISRGSVLNQFPTRLDLMAETLAAAIRILVDDVQARLETYDDPAERLRRLFDVLSANQHLPEGAVIIELLLAARWDADLAATIGRVLPAFEEEFDEHARQIAIRAGARDAEACVLRARMLVLALRGITLELMFDPERKTVLRALQEIGALYENFCDYMLGVTDVRTTPAARSSP